MCSVLGCMVSSETDIRNKVQKFKCRSKINVSTSSGCLNVWKMESKMEDARSFNCFFILYLCHVIKSPTTKQFDFLWIRAPRKLPNSVPLPTVLGATLFPQRKSALKPMLLDATLFSHRNSALQHMFFGVTLFLHP